MRCVVECVECILHAHELPCVCFSYAFMRSFHRVCAHVFTKQKGWRGLYPTNILPTLSHTAWSCLCKDIHKLDAAVSEKKVLQQPEQHTKISSAGSECGGTLIVPSYTSQSTVQLSTAFSDDSGSEQPVTSTCHVYSHTSVTFLPGAFDQYFVYLSTWRKC